MTKEHTPEEIKYRLSNLGVQIGNIAINYITELEKQLEETKLQNAICEEGLKKQIAEVEQEVKLWKKASENNSYKAFQLKHENAELKEQNTNLQEMLKTERSVTCKEEYLKRVAELEQENAELKAVERMALYSRMSDRLAKAEELLLELYDCIPSSMADSCKETLQKVALFFKDSEVEK